MHSVPEILAQVRATVNLKEIGYAKHAANRMLERDISRSHVIQAILRGEVVESYPDDKPYPSLLVADVKTRRDAR